LYSMGFATTKDIEQWGELEDRKAAFRVDGAYGKKMRRLKPTARIGNQNVGYVVFSHAGFPVKKTPLVDTPVGVTTLVNLKTKFSTVEGYNKEIMSHLNLQDQATRDALYGNMPFFPTSNRDNKALVDNPPEHKLHMAACAQAQEAAQLLGAKILVNAHNPDVKNHKIIEACGGLVYSIDAAMSRWIDMPYLDGSSKQKGLWDNFQPTGMLYPAYLEIDFTSGTPVAKAFHHDPIPKPDVTQPPEIPLVSSSKKSSAMTLGLNVGMGPNVGASSSLHSDGNLMDESK